MQWKIRDTVFVGAGTYGLGDLRFNVDDHGYFEAEAEPDVPLGVMAKRVRDAQETPKRALS